MRWVVDCIKHDSVIGNTQIVLHIQEHTTVHVMLNHTRSGLVSLRVHFLCRCHLGIGYVGSKMYGRSSCEISQRSFAMTM
ncbi:MAG: hypothetical protein RI942_1290, partial [Pseudomonadota bacterium]|jgi:hypothetical protein